MNAKENKNQCGIKLDDAKLQNITSGTGSDDTPCTGIKERGKCEERANCTWDKNNGCSTYYGTIDDSLYMT